MKLLHPNQKGKLGELAVCKVLYQFGFMVFVELGNHSKVDLIVLDEFYKPYKIQVKTCKSNNGCIEVYSVKSCLNPKYNSKYTRNQVDAFAIYVLDLDLVFFVNSKEILTNRKSSKFRLTECKNGQRKNVRFVNNYLDFKKALRD